MAYDLSVLDQGCQEMGIVLDGEQRQQFVDFYEYLVEKNKVMNLTGITEFQEVLVKHFLDSLACVKAVDIKKVKRMMDVGTGAGFPGVPLKIAFPHLEACLLDSLKKRVNFLEETFDLLKLTDITAVHEGDEKTGANIILKALEAPLFHISANAGLEGSVIINKVRESEPGVGFDALNEEYVNMVESGILDPAKVTRSALQNATSVASTLLTTESVVATIKEDTPAMPAGNPGMGMM